MKLTQLIEKLNRRLGGMKNMTRLPSMIFVVDVRREAIAIKEGNILDIRSWPWSIPTAILTLSAW